MNKKIVIICSALVLILVLTIGYVTYSLFLSPDDRKPVNIEMPGHFSAIPLDAIAILDFDTYEDMEKNVFSPSSAFYHFLKKGGGLNNFLTIAYDCIKDSKGAFSLHYSSKNKVDLLMVFDLSGKGDLSTVSTTLKNRCKGVVQKKYGGRTLYRSAVPKVNFTIHGDYLLLSSSLIVLESSLRYLEENSSVLEDNGFREAYAKRNGTPCLLINHGNIGKLFSGSVNYSFLKYAEFVNSFTEWSCLNLQTDGVHTRINGHSSGGNGMIGNYSSLLSAQKGEESDLLEILPFNTCSMLSLNLTDPEKFVNGYKAYIEYHKLESDYNYLVEMAKREAKLDVPVKTWFLSLGVERIAKASIASASAKESVLFIKAKNKEYLKSISGKLIPRLLGGSFMPSSYRYHQHIGDWIAIGEEGCVRKIASDIMNPNYFSFQKYISQTVASEYFKDENVVDYFLNLNSVTDSVKVVFKEKYAASILNGLEKHNFNFLTLHIAPGDDGVDYDASLFVDNVYVGGYVDESIEVNIPEGPFPIKNFVNGKTNYIEQLENHKIRLLDDRKRGVWTIPFETPICGSVRQIDYLKNKKLQILFASGSSLYLIDRVGRYVKGFPKDLKTEVVLGPEVYDFNKDLDYTLMFLHADNSIRIYNKNGEPVMGWNVICPDDKIISMPELLNVGMKRFWVVRMSGQTKIYNSDGVVVADFSKKFRITPDSKIVPVTGTSVEVTGIDKKTYLLSLETGEYKVKK